MTLTIQSAHISHVFRISLAGRFGFEAHRSFRAVSDEALEAKGVTSIVIDMHAVEYIDSSALGMLLLLRDQAQAKNITVSIARATGIPLQVLEIANFRKLFSIV